MATAFFTIGAAAIVWYLVFVGKLLLAAMRNRPL